MVFGITKNHHQDLPQHQQYATAPSSTADHHAAHSFVMFACKSGSPIPAFKSAICFLHLQMRLQHATEGKKTAQPADRITCRPRTFGSGDAWPNRKSTEKMFKRLSFWHAPREVQWPRTYCIHWGLTGGTVAQGMKMQPSGGITNTSQMVLAAGTNCAAACRRNFFKFGYIIALGFSIAWSVQKYLGHVFQMDFQTLRFMWHHPWAIQNWKLHIWYQQIKKWFNKRRPNPQTKKRPL